MQLIPLTDAAKTKTDAAAIATAGLSLFKAIPWPEVAAFLACIYTALRIVELVARWRREDR